MPRQVTLQPSGRRFTAQARESILDAALRAGLNMKYRCNNGTCGECAARLLAGEVAALTHSDFAFSRARKAMGYFLPCCHAADGDVTIEAAEYGRGAAPPRQHITAKVKKISAVAEDMVTLQLRTPRTRTLQFLAGQHAELRPAEGGSCRLAIASCPCNGMLLEFHIRRDGSDFCQYLFTRLRCGEDIELNGPAGDWSLDEQSRRPLLFIAHDTGFAGAKSVIEHAFALELAQPIYLYRITPAAEGYLQNLCRAWDDAMDNFFYHCAQHADAAAAAATIADDITTRATAAGIAMREADVYLAGATGVTQAIAAALGATGLPQSRLFIQRIGD